MSCSYFQKKVFAYLVWLLTCCLTSANDDCSRSRARIVRNIMTAELSPIYEEFSVRMPAKCPLSPERDTYSSHEAHKYMEAASKWTCNYCGKGFYEERFIDMHMDNRHRNMMKIGAESTCLADYCDVFRCDVVQGTKTASYWDVALCKETDLHSLQHKCEKLFTDCLPEPLSIGARLKLFEKLNRTICSFLNCDKYWELPESQVNPVSTAVYIMLFIIMFFGLLVYYYVAYTHFYTDESLLGHEQKSRLEKDDTTQGPYHNVPMGQEIRYRMGTR